MNPHFCKFHTELDGHYARIGKALASPVRVEILDVLAQRPELGVRAWQERGFLIETGTRKQKGKSA